MPRRHYHHVIIGVVLLTLAAPPRMVEARRYPIVKSDSSGTWIGTQGGLLHGVGELWSRYAKGSGLPVDKVRDVELSPRDVWVATSAGLARLNKGSRRWETFTAPQLPSSEVTAVSVDPSDPQQLWVGTRAGVALYDIRRNSWRHFGAKSGLPDVRVNDLLFRGRTVWAATEQGLAAYDLKLGTWKTFGRKDGLAADRVIEIDERGQDLWVTCEGGATRLNLQRRTPVAFGAKQGFPKGRVLAQASLQNLLYILTEGGLITYDTVADSLAPFLHARGLLKAKLYTLTTAGGYLWFGTDKGLMRFDPTKKAWQYYRVEDGLSDDDVSRLAVAGSLLLVFGGKERVLDSYDYKKDEWVERTALLGQAPTSQGVASSQPLSQPSSQSASQPTAAPKAFQLSVSAELGTEIKQELTFPQHGGFSREGYWLVNTLRLGMGAQWASGRKIDVSGKIDWGDIWPLFDGQASTLETFQRYDFELRYLGRTNDYLRELFISDELRLDPAGARLLRATELEGARLVLGLGPKRRGGRALTIRAMAGVRRGTPMRVVLRRPSVDALQIKRFKLFKQRTDGTQDDVRYVIPNSVRALLDGKELERNVDYFVDHENGVLWIKNTDLIHMLRVLEVEFEYEQIPRKNVGAVSMVDLLPRDGDIGQLKRSGNPRWARDEQALLDEIDGGAEQFFNRGWSKALFQDYEWNSAGITLHIHDMASETNANSIFLARRSPAAKPVPGLDQVFIERQPSAIVVKLVRGAFYIEITVAQGTMEQEVLAISGWLVSKLASSGGTSADALRDAVAAVFTELRLGANTTIGIGYIGLRSLKDASISAGGETTRMVRNLLSTYARHSQRLSRSTRLVASLQAAGSLNDDAGVAEKGLGMRGEALLTHPRFTMRLSGRKYSEHFGGLGVARQTEFCRTADHVCRTKGTSRLDHQLAANITARPARWLPISATLQRQATKLGSDYADAPLSRERLGVRHIASGSVGFEKGAWPKVALQGAFIQRHDALNEEGQWRVGGTFESDLAATFLKRSGIRKLYLRGLYEYGRDDVDEFRRVASEEHDRKERMHHAVGELRFSPTLTESVYGLLQFHQLEGVLRQDRRLVDRLLYWRLDAGAASSLIPGFALRLDATIWFGDDRPPLELSSTTADVELERTQQADSRLAAVMDLFFGEWVKVFGPLKLNAAYTYTLQTTSQGRRPQASPFGLEICEAPGDEDGDGLADCDDPDCALKEACLLKSGRTASHRAFGTLSWDTPGKLQIEIFGDLRRAYGEQDGRLRSTREELRSFVTWRPIYPSPITLRFDVVHETARPDRYDGIVPLVEPSSNSYTPALEWRRRWNARWWHLAKLALSHGRMRDLPHIRTYDDAFGREGDLERLDYNIWALQPSVEIRRRFEHDGGRWSFRPYARASYKLQIGEGVSSSIGDQTWVEGQDGMVNGSETAQQMGMSLGVIWVHGANLFFDLDLSLVYHDCMRAPTGSRCNDRVIFTPHLLTTVRY